MGLAKAAPEAHREITMAKATATAVQVTAPQHITLADAIRNAKAHAAVFHGQALALISACSVAMFVGAYSETDRKTQDQVRDQLFAEIGETGLKRAMTYRYVQIAAELSRRIVKAHGTHGGPVQSILTANKSGKTDAAETACLSVQAYIKTLHLANKDAVDNVDRLMLYLGMTKRDASGKRKSAKGNKRGGGRRSASSPAPTLGQVDAKSVTPDQQAQIRSVLAVKPDTFNGLKPETLAEAVSKSTVDRTAMIVRMVELIETASDIRLVMDACEARLKKLAAAEAKAKDEKDDTVSAEAKAS